MNIYDLINMKKDILINGYSTLSTLEESYECDPEEEYLNTICENFDLLLENANLQLFHYGSEEYIYEVLEENEYWDITEEGVVSSVGEGIKKIVESILSLIKKIFSFIGNLFSKIFSIFDRGSSEMDKVDKTIEEFNEKYYKAIRKKKDKKRAHEKRDLYGHDMNAKVNPKLNGPQSLDSLYNTFGKEIKIKCPLYKFPERNAYFKYRDIFEEAYLTLGSSSKLATKNVLIDVQNKIMQKLGCDNINNIRQTLIECANKTFMRNYKDSNPFDRETKISEIPLQFIKYYSYNADELKKLVKQKQENFAQTLEEIEEDINRVKKVFCGERDNSKDKTLTKELTVSLTFLRRLTSDFTMFHKTYLTNVTRVCTTSIRICKILTKQLFVKNEN